MSAQDTIGALATEIGLAFQPLADAFGSPNDFATFMEQLGWNMNSIPQALSGVAAPAAQIGALIQNDEVDSSAVAQLLAAIVGFVSAVSGISSEPAANFPPGLDVATFKSEFPQQTLDYLVVEYLLKRQGGYAHLLKLAGIISTQDVAASATRPAFTRRTVAWSGLGDLFSNPSLIFQQAYNWGQPTFLDDQFLQNVAAVLHGWGVNYRFAEVDPALFASLTAGALDPDKIYASALQVPFFEELYSGAGGAFGLELYILPQTATSFAGFAILPYASGDLAEDIPLSDSLTMHIRGQAQAAGGFAILFRPNNPLGLSTGAPGISANFSFGLSTQNPTGGKQLLLGSATGSRLEYSSLGFTVGLRTDSAATSFYGEVSLADGDIVIEPGADADSFLTQLLPSNLTVDASITLGLDSRLGVYFSGSTSLEITIPAHISLGPIEIQSASISIAPASGSLPVSFGATIQGNLGPLQAVVDDVGLTIPLTFPGSGGNLGPMNASLAFKPPKGVGLTINAGVVQGGGYLYIDTARGEYAGALQLEIADFLSVGRDRAHLDKDARRLARLLAAHYPHRRLRCRHPAQLRLHPARRRRPARAQPNDALPAAHGRRSNQLHPERHVPAGRGCQRTAHHQRPASDFSSAEWHIPHRPHGKDRLGRAHAHQPLAGVIIEIPPGDAAILGILRTALPADEVAILVLQVNFAGVLEFDKQRFYFYASLFDSHILFITISGSMGVLFAYGDNANFVLSVGGFHPQFNPPPFPFPAPERISIASINESYARIHADGYFAVTTNTVQFGIALRFLLRLLGLLVFRLVRIRRAHSVLAVPLHRRDLDPILGAGLRHRCLRRRHRRRAVGSGALARARHRIALLLLLLHRHRHRLHLGRQSQHDAAAGRGNADPRRRSAEGLELEDRSTTKPKLLVMLRQLDPSEAAFCTSSRRNAAGQPAISSTRSENRQESAASRPAMPTSSRSPSQEPSSPKSANYRNSSLLRNSRTSTTPPNSRNRLTYPKTAASNWPAARPSPPPQQSPALSAMTSP